MPHWKALAQAVIDRRVEQGHLSREAFAQASGISLRTLGDVESARRQSYAPETLVRLEKALGWPAGAVQGFLDRPRPAERQFLDADPGPMPHQLAELRRILPTLEPGLRDQALRMLDDLVTLLLVAQNGAPLSDEEVLRRVAEAHRHDAVPAAPPPAAPQRLRKR